MGFQSGWEEETRGEEAAAQRARGLGLAPPAGAQHGQSRRSGSSTSREGAGAKAGAASRPPRGLSEPSASGDSLLTCSGARGGLSGGRRGGGRSPPETGHTARAQADWAPRGLGKLSPSRAGREPHRRSGLVDCRPQAQRHPRCYSPSSCLSEMVQGPAPAPRQEGRSPRPRMLFPPSLPSKQPAAIRTGRELCWAWGYGGDMITEATV